LLELTFRFIYEVTFLFFAFFKANWNSIVDQSGFGGVMGNLANEYRKRHEKDKRNPNQLLEKLKEADKATLAKIQQAYKDVEKGLKPKSKDLPTQAEMQGLVDNITAQLLPAIILDASSRNNQPTARNWSDWQYIGYLTESDFPNSHPNFQACFKPGYYVAKCQINPDNHAADGYQWMFSLDTSLQGQTGGRNYDYPHYSVFYVKDGSSETVGEHFTPIAGRFRVQFRDEGSVPFLKEKGSSKAEKKINGWNRVIGKLQEDNSDNQKISDYII
jgi:hypothetical protein